MTEYLNEVEQSAVEAFYNNVGMRESVKKAMLATIYQCSALEAGIATDEMDFTKNPVLAAILNNMKDSNQLMGENLRALGQGLSWLETAFNKLGEVKKVEIKQPKPNKAR
jgi:hypothetical protein